MCTCNKYLVGVCWLCRHFQGELYIDIFDNAVKGILRKALNDAFRHICCCFISCTGTTVYREISPPPHFNFAFVSRRIFKTGRIQISNYLSFNTSSLGWIQETVYKWRKAKITLREKNPVFIELKKSICALSFQV